MEDALPQPTAGPELADLRRSVGVSQDDLADRLEVHRVTLSGWERSATVDGIKAARYRRALQELASEAVGKSA